MSPAIATEIEIAGGEEGDTFEVGKIYDVKLTTGIEFKGIVLAYDPDPHFVIFQEGTIPETGHSMNTRMVNENFISRLTYIGKCKDPLASKERWIDLSGSEEKEAIAIREIESIGVGVAAEEQKSFHAFSRTKIESIGVGVAAEAQKSFDPFSNTYPMEQDLVEEIPPFRVIGAHDIILAANMGLKKKIFAQKISRATNGAYFLMDEKMRKVAVFKPAEEEAEEYGCIYVGGKEKRRKGEKADREVAAYLLDLPKDGEGNGFGGVPPTTMVRCMDFKGDREKRWTKGSLQQFIPNQKWYVQSGRADDIFSILDFQKMTLLDIRYGNMDRNKSNILNQNGKLIPIDHGECFPKEFNRYRLDWTTWMMAEKPYLPEMVEHVKTLDVDKDFEILRTNGIELGDRASFVFRVQNMVLKLGVLGGNVPKEIGHLLTHPYDGHSEGLDTLFHKCRTRNLTGLTLMDSLEDSIRGDLQGAIKSRTLKELMERESMSMLSREEKKTESKPRECRRSSTAQKIFDAFSKTLPVEWVNNDILVWGEVRICRPYIADCVTGGTTTARDKIKALLKQVRQELIRGQFK